LEAVIERAASSSRENEGLEGGLARRAQGGVTGKGGSEWSPSAQPRGTGGDGRQTTREKKKVGGTREREGSGPPNVRGVKGVKIQRGGGCKKPKQRIQKNSHGRKKSRGVTAAGGGKWEMGEVVQGTRDSGKMMGRTWKKKKKRVRSLMKTEVPLETPAAIRTKLGGESAELRGGVHENCGGPGGGSSTYPRVDAAKGKLDENL